MVRVFLKITGYFVASSLAPCDVRIRTPQLRASRASSSVIFRKTQATVVLFLTLINVGCSYHFGAVKRTIPGAYDRVAVPVFKNLTSETGIETYFTKSMIEEIERGHIATVTDKEGAQVVIEGEVLTIQHAPGATISKDSTFPNMPTDTVLTKEYRILVEARINARRKSDQKVVWSGTFQGERRYPAPIVTTPVFNTVDPLYNQSSRNQNIEVMARDMMSEAYTRMTENF